MCCVTAIPVEPPRRATPRPVYLCRGRGDRSCRCHVAARPRLAHAPKLPPRVLRPLVTDAPKLAPIRPQGPPLPV